MDNETTYHVGDLLREKDYPLVYYVVSHVGAIMIDLWQLRDDKHIIIERNMIERYTVKVS